MASPTGAGNPGICGRRCPSPPRRLGALEIAEISCPGWPGTPRPVPGLPAPADQAEGEMLAAIWASSPDCFITWQPEPHRGASGHRGAARNPQCGRSCPGWPALPQFPFVSLRDSWGLKTPRGAPPRVSSGVTLARTPFHLDPRDPPWTPGGPSE